MNPIYKTVFAPGASLDTIAHDQVEAVKFSDYLGSLAPEGWKLHQVYQLNDGLLFLIWK